MASSAYQVEGAAKDEGKGPSIWDLIAHRDVNAVADNSTGDIVASHYWLYKQDFARLANLGVPYFSPSFSWYVVVFYIAIVRAFFDPLSFKAEIFPFWKWAGERARCGTLR